LHTQRAQAAQYLMVPRTGSICGHRIQSKHLRNRPAQDNPIEWLPLNKTAFAMVFKLVEAAQKAWQRA
jgi:hypothetical protein